MAGVGADLKLDLLQAIGLQILAVLGDELDIEAAAGHAQSLHFNFHGAGQCTGGSLAQLAQFACLFLVMAGVGGQFVSQSLHGFIVGIQAFQFVQQALLQLAQIAGLHAVLARQTVDAVEAILQLLLTLRVGIEVIDEAIEFADGFLHLDLRTGQQVGGLAECAGLIAEGAKPVEAGGQCGQDVAGIALAA